MATTGQTNDKTNILIELPDDLAKDLFWLLDENGSPKWRDLAFCLRPFGFIGSDHKKLSRGGVTVLRADLNSIREEIASARAELISIVDREDSSGRRSLPLGTPPEGAAAEPSRVIPAGGSVSGSGSGSRIRPGAAIPPGEPDPIIPPEASGSGSGGSVPPVAIIGDVDQLGPEPEFKPGEPRPVDPIEPTIPSNANQSAKMISFGEWWLAGGPWKSDARPLLVNHRSIKQFEEILIERLEKYRDAVRDTVAALRTPGRVEECVQSVKLELEYKDRLEKVAKDFGLGVLSAFGKRFRAGYFQGFKAKLAEDNNNEI